MSLFAAAPAARRAAAAVQQLQRPGGVGRRIHQCRGLRPARAGPEHRRRHGRPARPRLRRVLRDRRVHHAFAASPIYGNRRSRSGRCCSSEPRWRRSSGSCSAPRPCGLRGDYLAIVTLGFGEIVPIVFINLSNYTEGPNGIGGIYSPTIGGLRLPDDRQSVAVLRDDGALIIDHDDPDLPPAGQPARAVVDGHPRG